MISYGAASISERFQSSQLTTQLLQCRNKVMQAINKRVQVEGKDPSTHLLVSVCGTICSIIETGRETREDQQNSSLVQVHAKGLRCLIKAAGGWNAIKERSFELTWLLIWFV
jgi:hypothetical protein